MKKKIILVRVLRRYRRGQGWNPGKPECFLGFLLTTAKVAYLVFLITRVKENNNNENWEVNNISCKYFSLFIFRKTRNTTKKHC